MKYQEEHASYGMRDLALQQKKAHTPIEHSVKRRNLIHTHRRHLQQLRHIVHHADTRPSLVLSLPEIEQRDDGGFLVLRWVLCDDFFRAFEVLGGEFEGYLRASTSVSGTGK